ncbi:MAG: glycosyltransferase [Desulfovibrio sp.]|nr:glycosyltransferase [Desulfovibrio sp.]
MDPIFNVTIPVYNRLQLTQRTILKLRNLTRHLPLSITVVDNGSDEELRKRLITFAEEKIIDQLFILDKNYGISFACNLGWRSLNAPIFVKIDNDILITNRNFFTEIFELFKIFGTNATIGPTPEIYGRSKESFDTKYGHIGICTSNLPGCALFIPKEISETVGYFNEDYGLYGSEDWDYGLRMNFLGLKQYFYEMSKYIEHLGTDKSDYQHTSLDKTKEHRRLVQEEDGGIGLVALNAILYELSIRHWNVPLRYEVYDQDGYFVRVSERKAYQKVKDALAESKKIADSVLVNYQGRIRNKDLLNFTEDHIRELKSIWANCEQA